MKYLNKLCLGSGKHNLYIYQVDNKKFLFKELNHEHIGYELLIRDLAKLMHIDFFNCFEAKTINNSQGIIMDYCEFSETLYNFPVITNEQLEKLKIIMLLDLIVGNKDRHTANILIYHHKMIPIDHTKLFSKDKLCSTLIKLDVGRKLDQEYAEKIENILQDGKKLSVKTALQTHLGFSEEQFKEINQLDTSKLKEIVMKNSFIKDKNLSYEYILMRIKNLGELGFI